MTSSEVTPADAPVATPPPQRWRPLPMSLVAGGVMACFVTAIFNSSSLGWWQLLIYAGGLAALGALFWFRRELTAAEWKLEATKKSLAEKQEAIDERERQLEVTRREIQQQVEQQVTRLDNREQKLAE